MSNSNQSHPAGPGASPFNPPPPPPRPPSNTTVGVHISHPGNRLIIIVSCGGLVLFGLIGLFVFLKYNWQMPKKAKYIKASLNAFEAEINPLNQQDSEAGLLRNGDCGVNTKHFDTACTTQSMGQLTCVNHHKLEIGEANIKMKIVGKRGHMKSLTI
jgi:hypothetical protein